MIRLFRSRRDSFEVFFEIVDAVAEFPASAALKPVFLPAHLREALAHAAMEGLQPSPEGRTDLEAVSGGQLDGPGFLDRIKARYGL